MNEHRAQTESSNTHGGESVAKYRKKPVVIEAMQFTRENMEEVARWCGGSIAGEMTVTGTPIAYALMYIPTLEGVMDALTGDWIIKGVKGEFYPCKPDIFEATYELVEPTDD